ncbi:MAG: DUF177 domain-containing protein [Acidocella sp.]|nr:DUF177 domain-containing protein [Acidocella sp.]
MSDEMSEIFSRRMKLGGIATAPVTRVIAATAAECAALAALFGLPAIAALEGEFAVSHERGGVLLAAVKLSARVTQICVVTLEPFETKISESTKLRFVPAAKVREAEPQVLDAETLDGPDEIPYNGEAIDLGAVLAEQLALTLDPYPRKPGAKLPEGYGEEDISGPFAALLPFRKPGD